MYQFNAWTHIWEKRFDSGIVAEVSIEEKSDGYEVGFCLPEFGWGAWGFATMPDFESAKKFVEDLRQSPEWVAMNLWNPQKYPMQPVESEEEPFLNPVPEEDFDDFFLTDSTWY